MIEDKDKDKQKEESIKKEYGDASRKILEIINKSKKSRMYLKYISLKFFLFKLN